MTFIFFLILFIYLAVLLGIALVYLALPIEQNLAGASKSGLSIIVCIRNEEKHLAACLQSLLDQDYDKDLIQLILVDDNSQDQSIHIAQSLLNSSGLDFLLIRNAKREGKKVSIVKAVSEAKHKLILLRDADTLSPDKSYLSSMLAFQKKGNYDLVIGPVTLFREEGLLSLIQQIENNILQILSAGTAALNRAFLCSGANMLFTRTAYESVNGFRSHIHLESGDDVFFLEDLKKTGKARIAYLKSKEAQVQTYPELSWAALFRQKTRWASKFRYNPNLFNSLLASLVFAVNFLWVLLFLHPFFFFQLNFFFVLFILLKSGADIFLLFLSRSFMPIKLSVPDLFLCALVYPFYALVIGFRALLFKPNWN